MDDLPDLVLLYDENEAGKSNAVGAIQNFFQLLGMAWNEGGLYESYEWHPQDDSFIQNTTKDSAPDRIRVSASP